MRFCGLIITLQLVEQLPPNEQILTNLQSFSWYEYNRFRVQNITFYINKRAPRVGKMKQNVVIVFPGSFILGILKTWQSVISQLKKK